MSQKIFYIGTEAEVAHHVRPLSSRLDIEILSPEKVLDVATRDDLAIFFSEHFHRFRTAIENLKQKQCRTLYAIDGILEWRNAFENRKNEPACPWTMRPVLSHKVACIGRSQARQLEFWGNRSKIELVGLPRLDEWAKHGRGNRSGETASTNQNETGSTPAIDPIRIMVMTAKWPAFNEEQLQNVRQSLLDLKTWFDEANQSGTRRFEITWRLAGELDQAIGVENSLIDTGGDEFQRQLENCDCLMTTPSTAMLEGMLAGLPTAVLEYNPVPQLTNSVWQIRHRDQIDSVVAELIDPSERKMAQQDFFLHDALEIANTETVNTPASQSATDRLVLLIEGMLSHAADVLPEQIVPVDQAVVTDQTGSQFLWNRHQLFETDSLREAQAHAAQLERDVARLEARNAVLEREFKKAKKAIDDVIENPIVSPLLKVGTFAGKFFKKPAP